MSHSWEIKEKHNVNIRIPSGFKSYQIGPVSLFKLINSKKGKYKDDSEASIAAKDLIINIELKKLYSALSKTKFKYFKGIDTVFYKNRIESLIESFEKNTFEKLSEEIYKMIKENINGGKLNNFETLIDKTVNGYMYFWSTEYPKLEKNRAKYHEFRKNTLNSLEVFEKSIKSNKKNLRIVDRKLYKQLDEALLKYEIDLNSSSIIKKNHIFKKLISNDNLLEENYENIEKFQSWLSLESLIVDAVETTVKKAELERIAREKAKAEAKAEADRIAREKAIQIEKETNFEETGYLETDIERKAREDKILNEFKYFKNLIEKCRTIQLIPEVNLINNQVWEETNIKLDTLDELTFEDYQIDKIECNNLINKLSSELEEIKINVLKPYEQIKKFLYSKQDKLLIIKGMAGTGKTECINKIIQYYWQKNSNNNESSLSKKIIVCSPTTVGAANIRQKGFFNAQTLEYFLNKWESIQQLELFIVDEASMLTKNQLTRINKKFNNNNSIKFVFIGDEGQFRPVDFKKGAESESFALNLNYSSKIFGSGFQIFLENDFRIKSYFSSEYYEFISSLRKDNIKSPLEALNNVLNNTNDIEVVKESNLIINFFNKYVHIGSSVRERLVTDTAEEILYYLKKKDEFNEMKFEDHAVLEAIKLYRGQKTRRPELGELYAQYYPKVEERLSKKNNLNTIISLFRSNVKADISNILIRPHIFGEGFKDNHPILKGEVMFIKQRKNSIIKNYLIKTELGVGDSFIVTKEPQPLKFKSIDKCALKEVIEDKVWLLEVKPVLKFSKGKLGTFLLNVVPEMFNLDTRKIVVWIGDLIELKNSNDELLEENDLNKIYKNVVNEIINLELDENLHTKPISHEDIMQVARVKYDYARVSYASQGGEWDRVIIQLEDSWDDSRFLYTSFTRAVKKNYLFN